MARGIVTRKASPSLMPINHPYNRILLVIKSERLSLTSFLYRSNVVGTAATLQTKRGNPAIASEPEGEQDSHIEWSMEHGACQEGH